MVVRGNIGPRGPNQLGQGSLWQRYSKIPAAKPKTSTKGKKGKGGRQGERKWVY